jgi:methylase of polypeptide subunit release factors
VSKDEPAETALKENSAVSKELDAPPGWQEFVSLLNIEADSPPSDFTKLLVSATMRRLRQRRLEGSKTETMIELGAKEAAVSLWFAKIVPTVVATEADSARIELIRHNLEMLRVANIKVIRSARTDWFPEDIAWHSADMILANPPSVPKPSTIPPKFTIDREVLFSGSDGRYDTGLIVAQARDALAVGSELIIVGADYVLEDWLQVECFKYGLTAIELGRTHAISRGGELDWEIRDHIREALGWEKFRVENDTIGYDRVAYSVFWDRSQ